MKFRAGMRVVVRHQQPDGVGDALGEVVSADDRQVVVQTRGGPRTIALESVLLAHEVPPAPTRAGALHEIVSPGDLMRIAVGAWLPGEAVWLHADNLAAELAGDEPSVQGGWLLRNDGGVSRRGSSILPLSDPGMPVDQALTAAEQWYRDRGRPVSLQLFSTSEQTVLAEPCREVAALARARGCETSQATLQLTGSVREAVSGLGGVRDAALPGMRITVTEEPADEVLTALGQQGEGAARDSFRQLLTSPANHQFLSAHSETSGSLIAACRLAEVHKWAVVGNVVTAPALRRRGAGRAVVRAALTLAAHRGVRSFLAEVESGNEPSLRLFAGLGATPRQRYWFARWP